MLPLLFAPLAACTEYGFVHDKPAPSGPTETGEPPAETDEPPEDRTCEGWEPPETWTVTPDDACLNEPPIGTFTPVVEWQWTTNEVNPGYDDIMAAPAVGNLDDDDGDGLVTEDDIPDIVFTTFASGAYTTAGALNAIRGDGSGMLWSALSAGGYSFFGTGGVAIGDLDADGRPEVCTSGAAVSVICVDGASGALVWAAGSAVNGYGAPALADLDGDGFSEVIIGAQVFDHQGVQVFAGSGGTGSSAYHSFAVDWDGDPELEVIAGNTIYDPDGTILWLDGLGDGSPAVGDFDADGLPDLVRAGGGTASLVFNDGTVGWTVSLPGGGSGGAPTVADFDGDGAPEVGVADLSRYSMFDTDGTLVWSNTVSDYSSSRTGSSVFDFEGDGAAEVVYADEHTLWAFDGATGGIVMEQAGHASGTLMEYPLIADVDNDDSTEIVVVSNDYAFSGWHGVTVIGDAKSTWAPARPIWNQFAYHITNVENDGGIPAVPVDNWLTWNNFRAGGTELGPSHWLADLRPGEPAMCRLDCDAGIVRLWVPVENGGLLDASEFDVALYADLGASPVATATLSGLASGASAWAGEFTLDAATWGTGELTAVVDRPDAVAECDETDNSAGLGEWPCE